MRKLKVEIDEGSGFCFGVTTAIRKAEEELAERRYTILCRRHRAQRKRM